MPVRKSNRRNILFSLIFIIIFFSFLELLCRGLFDLPARDQDLEYIVDPDSLWHFAPDQHVIQQRSGIEYVINSRGLRCPDFPLEKPGDERRILTVGDSVTLGYGVTEGEEYPRLLEEYLEEHFPDGRVRVINGGVNAYSTIEELKFLRRKGIHYKPDVVILGFVINDVSRISRQYYVDKFGTLLTRGSVKGRLKNLHEVLSRSHIVSHVSRVTKLIGARIKGGGRRKTDQEKRYAKHMDLLLVEKEDIEKDWMTGMKELEEIAGFLHDNSVEMVLVLFPVRIQLEESPTPDTPQKKLREFCEDRNIMFIDLLPLFLENKDDGLFLDIIHLSAAGNRLVAREIGDYLVEKSGFR